ncbi:MAG: hypothetical protein HQL67_10305 [Magnetococcales bacterium]|nr:hypothetical protein [Magnetococcales bacterium]
MPTFTVCTPLQHNGHRYEPGTAVELTLEQGATLVSVGVVEQGFCCGAGESFFDEQLEQAIEIPLALAISRLDPVNPSLWRRDGRPRTEALAAIVGRRVSALERDQIWQYWTKEQKQ